MAPEKGVTAASFKQKMVDDARELSKLPGVGGPIVKDGFGFGFKDIITGGSMPEASKLDSLQRQWSEVKTVVELLSAAGATELTSVSVAQKKDPEPEQGARGRKQGRGAAEPEPRELASAQSYEFRFLARPAAFVRVLNSLATCNRFMTVDDFSLVRNEDALASVLGGGKDKLEGSRPGKRRGKQRGLEQQAESGEKEEIAKKGLVTDPASAAPFAATIALTTYDFGSKAESKGVEAKEEQE
jgi:hypothetical protein